jgi:hypothetical protein
VHREPKPRVSQIPSDCNTPSKKGPRLGVRTCHDTHVGTTATQAAAMLTQTHLGDEHPGHSLKHWQPPFDELSAHLPPTVFGLVQVDQHEVHIRWLDKGRAFCSKRIASDATARDRVRMSEERKRDCRVDINVVQINSDCPLVVASSTDRLKRPRKTEMSNEYATGLTYLSCSPASRARWPLGLQQLLHSAVVSQYLLGWAQC